MTVSVGMRTTRVALVAALFSGPAPHGCRDAPADVTATRDREPPPGAQSRDSTVRLAAAAVAAGRPFKATRLLDPVLRDPARRTPDAVLLAAAAAAGWGGWTHVRELLAGAAWVDTAAGGEGRALLAVAALEQGDDTVAVRDAEAAVRAATSAGERARRFVYLARALDRVNARDSARAVYGRAADALPLLRDWLRLRAAGVTADSAARAAQYAGIGGGAARARIPWTEAQARERAGDYAGAAVRYDSLGAPSAALRARLAGAGTDTLARAAIRSHLLALLHRSRGSADAKAATELLDRAFAPLTAEEELAIGRSAAAGGAAARAEQGLARALDAGGGTPDDRFAHAVLLARLGRHRDAAREFAAIDGPRPLVATAAYQRARSLLLSGEGVAARAMLASVVRSYADVPAGATAALLLQADLATDDGRDADARATFLDLARRYPAAPQASLARFRAAIIAFAGGDARLAADELDALRTVRGDEQIAATYWAGRAWAASGDAAKARERWGAVAGLDPVSYYTVLAARRLGDSVTLAAPPADQPPRGGDPAAVEAARVLARGAALERLGMDVEARFEYDRLAADADTSADALLTTAEAFLHQGHPTRAIQMAQRLQGRVPPTDTATMRRIVGLLYPAAQRDVIVDEARRRGIDPALVAGLIKQESGFNPRATSVAGARGLMQLLPSVGQTLARNAGYPLWDPALLYQPDVNIELGVAHLARLVRGYPDLARVLAAYNAGESRVTRWAGKNGVEDAEVFAERIPYVETREYVRAVIRNRAFYAPRFRHAADGDPGR